MLTFKTSAHSYSQPTLGRSLVSVEHSAYRTDGSLSPTRGSRGVGPKPPQQPASDGRGENGGGVVPGVRVDAATSRRGVSWNPVEQGE